MRRGDMGHIEQEVADAEHAAWRKVLMMGGFILASNLASTAVGTFFGFLIWGV